MKTEYKTFDEKVKKGYSLLKELGITCVNCQLDLIKIIQVQNSGMVNKVQAICPKCGEDSFVTTIKGKILLDAASGMIVTDVKTVRKDEQYRTIMSVKQC